MNLDIVVIGAHCSGKSTLCRELAKLLECPYLHEIGEELALRAGSPAELDDETILQAESARDVEQCEGLRIIETWHFGNAAWCEYRDKRLGRASGTVERMLAAARKAQRTIICFALQCDEDVRRQRRAESGRQRMRVLHEGQTEDDVCETTLRAGCRALEIARQVLTPHTIETDKAGEEDTAAEMQRVLLARLLPKPDVVNVPLFLSLQSARATLDIAAELLPEFRKEYLRAELPTEPTPSEFGGTVVVVEGLDGSGKTTLVESLAEMLDVPRLASPPARFQKLRDFIDSAAGLRAVVSKSAAFKRVKRAFYTLGNYALAEDLAQHGRGAVIDRFALSTLAYTIGPARLEHEDDDAIPAASWPSDLPKPSLILVLKVEEATRLERIHRRGEGVGEWERATEQDPRLGLAIFNELASSPDVTVIDANGTPDHVLQAALLYCTQ